MNQDDFSEDLEDPRSMPAHLAALWSAVHELEDPSSIPKGHVVALWVAVVALVAEEPLFRYMLAFAQRIKSSMLVAHAWHARSDAASSLVVGRGIVESLAGYPILDPLAALIVGLDDGSVEAIRLTLMQAAPPGAATS